MKEVLILFFLVFIRCGYEYIDCSDFEIAKQEYCEYLDPGDDNKVCKLINNKCISSYKDCEDYKGNDENICQSITTSFDYKCIISKNKCIQKPRVCSDFKFGFESNSLCAELSSTDEDRMCFFMNDKCEEIYRSCEAYNGKNSEICESIIPYDYENEIEYNYKCIIENGKCIKKERFCNDSFSVIGVNYYCPLLATSNKLKRCVSINNKCVEQYKKCEDYNGNNNKECESIEPYDENIHYTDYQKKCVFENKKCITKEKTSCSDYKLEGDKYSCVGIKLKDTKKVCVFIDNKCKETYKTCEDYDGNNKEMCQSIIPTYEKDEINWIDYESKCVLGENNKCVTTTRNCNEFLLSGELCQDLTTNDENKVCFDYYGECIENYESCEDYNGNVEKAVCESIIPSDYKTTKCVYDSENRECMSEILPCTSFQSDAIKETCKEIGFENDIKCVYSNGKCTQHTSENTNKGDESSDGRKINCYKLFLILYYILIL